MVSHHAVLFVAAAIAILNLSFVSAELTRQECTEAGGVIVGDIGDGSTFRPGYLCESNGEPPFDVIVSLPGEPVFIEGAVCCGQRSGPGPFGCPATIPENVGERYPPKTYSDNKGKKGGKDSYYHGQSQGKKDKYYWKMPCYSACQFESIVAFGDSTTDVGIAALSEVCDPPLTGVFCNQRNSNGALLVEFLAASLNVGPMSIALAPGGNNFAVAGASTSVDDLVSIVTQAFLYGVATGLLPDDPQNPSPIPPGSLEPPNSKRLHFISAGGNEVLDALFSDVATFLGFENVQETSLSPEGFVQAGADGLGVILSTLLSLPGVCNVLLYGTSDLGIAPITIAIDEFFTTQGHPGVAQRATENSILSFELFQREVAKVQAAFDSKCQAAGAEFGIHLVNTIELVEQIDKRLFPNTATNCNDNFVVSQVVCEATIAPIFLEVPFIPLSEDGSSVLCRFNAAPPVDCDCKGFVTFDEFHFTTAFQRELAALSLDLLNEVCHAHC
ncbi:hypothetical protein ACA910_009192 [Epithemia clementina (nom. ined.)]